MLHMIEWDLNPSASQVQNCWCYILGNCFCLSVLHKVTCIHTNQIKANQIINSNPTIKSYHIKSSNQIKSNQIISHFCCSYLSFLILSSKARIIWLPSRYIYFQTAKTARYYPNTAEVTRLAWKTINNRTETQYSTKMFPTPKSPITFPEKLNEKTVFRLRLETATNEITTQDGTWCNRKHSADIVNRDIIAVICV